MISPDTERLITVTRLYRLLVQPINKLVHVGPKYTMLRTPVKVLLGYLGLLAIKFTLTLFD